MKPDPNLIAGRHPAVAELAGHFDGSYLRLELQPIAAELEHTSRSMIRALPDCPELTVGLRKLLEARDCFVRAADRATPEQLGRLEP